ncbi:MAG: hypothetical protein MUP97_10365, partial [Acidimicrobiia bacterium]|nr:hypothetical protein [Acidimicrobiia bacterium]
MAATAERAAARAGSPGKAAEPALDRGARRPARSTLNGMDAENLGYDAFDADNHYYEAMDAF